MISNKSEIYKEIEKYIEDNYAAEDINYSYELDDIIKDLKAIAMGTDPSVKDSIIDILEDQIDGFSWNLITQEDENEIDDMIYEIANSQIDYLDENCEVIEDESNNEDNDWD